MDPLDVRRTRPAKSNAKAPLRETGSQTAGPYVHIGCLPNRFGIEGVYPTDLITNAEIAADETIRITGHVFEGDGIACKDILLEFWQADQEGDYANGIWHRSATDLETSLYEIETVKPGAVTDRNGDRLAPSINVWVVARGINIGLHTRLYFPEDAALHARDPNLALVEADRRPTLMAAPTGNSHDYRFDIHLQGKTETVFFEI